MERSEVIKEFLKAGFQLSPSVLEYLVKNEEEIKPFIEYLGRLKPKPLIVTKKELMSYLSQGIHLLALDYTKKKNVTTEDVLTYYKERFEFLKKTLTRRIELVNLLSINKTKRSKKFSIVGIVREKKEDRLTIEDFTGSLEVIIPSSLSRLIVEDEVIGIRCMKVGNEITIQQVIFPDIPFLRETAKKVEGKVCVAYRTSEFNGSLPIIGVQINSPLSIDFKEICWVVFKGLRFLLIFSKVIEKYAKQFKMEFLDTLVVLLKKRHLNPLFKGFLYDKDPFFIKEIPDFLICLVETGNLERKNYKGVTLLTLPKGNFVIIDLAKRTIIS